MDNNGTGLNPNIGGEPGDADEFRIRQNANYVNFVPLLNTASVLGLDYGFQYPFALISGYAINLDNLNGWVMIRFHLNG